MIKAILLNHIMEYTYQSHITQVSKLIGIINRLEDGYPSNGSANRQERAVRRVILTCMYCKQFIIQNYTLISNLNIGGGVCFYIRSSLSYKVWADLKDDDIESLWISIKLRRMPRATPLIILDDMYMSPECPARPRKEKEYITHILTCLDTVTRRHPSSGIIIMGVFNHMKDNLLKRYPLTQTVY